MYRIFGLLQTCYTFTSMQDLYAKDLVEAIQTFTRDLPVVQEFIVPV